MVYFKMLLNDKRPKEDRIYPVVVRVTYNRKNTTFNTGIRVKDVFWDALSSSVKHAHPNAQTYNRTITDFYSKIQNLAYQLVNDGCFSFEMLKEHLDEKTKIVKVAKVVFFKDYADQLISDMFSINKAGNATIYQTATNRLMGYANNPKLKFTEVTYTFLEGFKRSLMKDGVKANSISNYFRTLRAIFNKAIKAKLVDRSHYPFLDITVKTERTAKRAITIKELNRLIEANLKPKSQMWSARNYFFLSFSLVGASFTDLAYLKTSNIKKGRLIYRRRKTGKELSIKLQPFTLEILKIYSGSNSNYLIPVLPANIIEDSKKAKSVILQWIKTTNKYLDRLAKDCGIEDDITTYVARHSWATTAKRLRFAIEMIAEAMGHEHGNRITNIYLDTFDQSLLDDMNYQVIRTILPCTRVVKIPYQFALQLRKYNIKKKINLRLPY